MQHIRHPKMLNHHLSHTVLWAGGAIPSDHILDDRKASGRQEGTVGATSSRTTPIIVK